MFWFFFPLVKSVSKTNYAPAIITICCVGVLFIVVMICIFRMKCIQKRKEEEKQVSITTESQKLIPPLFYTDGLQDPLMQPDLTASIPKAKTQT